MSSIGTILSVAILTGAAALTLAPTTVSAQECRTDPYPGINWSSCAKRNLMLSGSDFSKGSLAEADLSFTDLRDSNFVGTNLTKAKLIRTWMAGSNAEGANFSKVEAYRSDFQKVRANDANFTSAELERSNFSKAELNNARFEKAELGRSNFDGAVLTGASFAFANLARADLTKAEFKGPLNFQSAFFFLTRIEGVDLSSSIGLDQHQLNVACGDRRTKLPAGLTLPESWPCGDREMD